MATIQQSIALSDGVSGPLAHIASATQAASDKFERMTGVVGRIEGVLSSTLGQFALAGVAAGYIQQLSDAILHIPGQLTKLSDSYSGIQARIGLVTESQEDAVRLNDQIYQSALRARGGYAEMADAVSKIAMTAKEAFPDAHEVVPFMEGIQKLFAIGGTDKTRQQDALLQLTQALGSGKLQGDEFRSIAEAAPLIESMVAKYMNVSQGELKTLSSEGAITAEVLKNAILKDIDEINEQFGKIPKKWSDIWTEIESKSFRAFTPVFEQISAVINSPVGQQFSDGIVTAAALAAAAIAGIVNNVRWIGEEVGRASDMVGTAFEYIAGFALSALTVYAAGWAVANLQVAVAAGYHGLLAGALVFQNTQLALSYVRTTMAAAGMSLWALATGGVTAAMQALNLTLMVNPIGMVVFMVGVVIAAFGAWAVASYGLRNVVADVFEGIVSACQAGVNTMIGAINGLISIINTAASGINSLFGTKIAPIEAVGEVSFEKFQTRWGNAIREGRVTEEIIGKNEIQSDGSWGATSYIPDYSELENSGKETADNTKAIKDAMEIVDEDIKYMRDFAEREAINQYTTAEIKVELGGIEQNISSSIDVDGVIDEIVAKIQEGIDTGAENVHR